MLKNRLVKMVRVINIESFWYFPGKDSKVIDLAQ